MARPKKDRSSEESFISSLSRVSKTHIKQIFGYSFQALAKWSPKENGFENEDNTWDLIKCIRWREEKAKSKGTEDRAELEIEKLKKEIEFKDSQIQKNLRNLIERSLHDQIMASRASSLRNFWEGAVLKNKHRFAMKTPDEVFVLLMEFIAQGLKVYANGGGAENESI